MLRGSLGSVWRLVALLGSVATTGCSAGGNSGPDSAARPSTSTSTSDPGTSEGASPTDSDGTSGTGVTQCGNAPASTREVVESYILAWREPDEARRLCLLAHAWADAGDYADPTGSATGRQELAAFIGAFQSAFPGATIALEGEVVEHHGALRFDWRITGSAIDGPGMDFAELADDGRLARVVGFFGSLPSTGAIPGSYVDYTAAWNESDPAERDARIAAATTREVRLVRPAVDIEGRNALAAYIGERRAAFPGTDIELASGAGATGNVQRIAWNRVASAKLIDSGLDIVELDSRGQIARVVGFPTPTSRRSRQPGAPAKHAVPGVAETR